MKLSRFTVYGLLLLCTCLMCSGPALGDGPGAANEQIKQDIEGFLKGLDAPDPVDRNAAQMGIEDLTEADIPVIEDLAQHLELSAKAKTSLATAMARLRPRTHLEVMKEKRDLEVTNWMRSSILMDAKMHGRKTAWLDLVQKALDLDAKRCTATRMKETKTFRDEERQQIDAAIAAGCTDPSFLALNGLISASEGASSEKVFSIFKQARANCTGLQVSPYMMFAMDKRILWGMADNGFDGGFTHTTWPEVRKRYCEMFDMLGAIISSPDVPMQVKYQATDLQLQTAQKLNIQIQFIYDADFAPLEKLAPNDAQMLALKGNIFHLLAWESRGSGLANSVTPQQWKDFADRLKIAGEALEKSYQLDPTDPAAATDMIIVTMGQDGDRDTMEKWFKRAMDANPDNIQACYNKLYYLEPKWHNDPAAMLEFGHQCLSDANWHCYDMPMLIGDAHYRLSKYAPDLQTYYHMPGVWEDLKAAYTAALELYPDWPRIRSTYCYDACLCGQWKEADAQFKLLGDKADASVFGGDARMLQCKKAAATLAAR